MRKPWFEKVELGPVVTVTELIPIRRAKCRSEISDKLVLGLLGQSHTEQLKLRWRGPLPDVVGESGVPGETNFKILPREPIQPSVIQTLHSQRVNRFDLMAFGTQSADEFSRQILVEEDLHARWGSC